MIHGHSKIELTNIKTGEVQVVEHDNYMTNYLRDILTPMTVNGYTWPSISNSYESYFTMEKLFGGIILFKEPLDNNPNNYVYPLDNDMVAHGGAQSYSGTDLTRGSFNSGVSSVETDSATFVWDFNENQGNGTISSLGLTTQIGGAAGSGNPLKTDTTAANNVNVLNTSSTKSVLGNIPSNGIVPYFDDENEVFYIVTWSSPTLTIKKYSFPFYKTVNPFLMKSNYNRYIAGGTEIDSILPRTTTTVTTQLSNYNMQGACDNNGKYYLMVPNNWSNGDSRTIEEIDLATGTINHLTITNRTGATLAYSTGLVCNDYLINNGYMYIRTNTDYKWAYINISDDTDCGLIKTEDENDFVSNNGMICNYFGRIYFGGAAWSSSSGQTQVPFLYTKNTVRFLDAYMRYYSGSSPNYRQTNSNTNKLSTPKFYGYIGEVYNSNAPMVNLNYNPLCLQTKNNLATPITKTSDMTMRVTYTLTKE